MLQIQTWFPEKLGNFSFEFLFSRHKSKEKISSVFNDAQEGERSSANQKVDGLIPFFPRGHILWRDTEPHFSSDVFTGM